MEKVEIGKHYKNIHTDIICKVTAKIFFNIQYDDLDDRYHTNPHYTHYKKFRKHWIECPEDEIPDEGED